MTKPAADLLSPEFLARLETLREAAFRLHRKGELRGFAAGQAPEFDTHRSYEPGDDPRYIDWNVFARLERLLLKMYVLDDETQISILVDTSRSMSLPGPGKRNLALKLAASFAYLALSANHNVFLGAFSDRLEAVTGPYRSKDHFTRCLHFLVSLPQSRRTDLGSGVGEFLMNNRGPGLFIIISDFFQERDVVTALDRFLFRKADLHLLQVVDEAEVRPNIAGECTVSDPEGEGSLSLSVGYDLQESLHRSIAAYLRGIEEACRERSIPYLLARTSDGFEDLLLRHLIERARILPGGKA
jgi:uncharacterized protein (DUF58 family)